MFTLDKFWESVMAKCKKAAFIIRLTLLIEQLEDHVIDLDRQLSGHSKNRFQLHKEAIF